jgi:hypothetical protein
MSLITELNCNVMDANTAILLNAFKSTVYLSVQNGDTVALPVNAHQQYIVFNPIDNTGIPSTTVTTTIDVSRSNIGDQLIIMASCVSTSPVNIMLPPAQMLMSRCGNRNQQNKITMGVLTGYFEVVHTFTFDGTQFVCGFDNC